MKILHEHFFLIVILTLNWLFVPSPVWAGSILFTSTTDQDKGAMYACDKSTFDPGARDPDGDGVFTACTKAQTKSYSIDKFKGVLDSWKSQREQAVNNSVNLKVVFRNATIAQKCSAMTALGVADPDSHLPVGEVCP